MGQYFNVGNAGFASVAKRNYVDKTGLIEYINSTLGTSEKLTCVSRPRRFGKSFAAKMLCAYYDKSCDSRALFANRIISQSPEFEKHLNQYNVIYIDMIAFMPIYHNDKANIVGKIQNVISLELQREFPDITMEMDDLPTNLVAIAESTGEKFIIIIDEWDALFREAKEAEQQQEDYIRLLRALFKDSGRTDKVIEAAYMTGILPIKKYGTQSAMTDFQEFNMLNPEPLEEYAGFTEEEVKELCKGSRLDFEELQKWYDGYFLGTDVHVYSPKSVMDALKRKRIGNYWTQSETYESLRIYIDMDLDGLKEAIMDMLCGKAYRINSRTFQNDMTSIKRKDDVLTLLVHLGYLAYNAIEETVVIPNEEVREEFLNAIENGNRSELMQLIRTSDQLLADTIAMKADAVASAIQEAHSIGTAPLFYNNEQALRSIIRFSYICAVDDYQMIQEMPSGNGYADLVFVPKRSSDKPAMLVELKWNKTENAAISQIKENNYPEVLKGITDSVLLVGINYDEKTKKHSCIIEKWALE